MHITYQLIDSTGKTIPPLQNIFESREAAENYIDSLPNMLSKYGFMTASVDAVLKDSADYKVQLFLGEKFYWKELEMPDSLALLLSKLNYRKIDFINQPYNQILNDKLFNDIIEYYAEKGYPFAKAGLQHVILERNTISATLFVDKGYIYNIDSIVVIGSANTSAFYLQKILGIEMHTPYNAAKLRGIDEKLRNLPYLHQSHPWEMRMTSEGAVLQLYLDKKAVNELDAIIGFSSGENEVSKKLSLNGQVRANFRNAFGGGEYIAIDWQQLRAQSPRLSLTFGKPYLFRSSFGVDFNFDLYKLDSSYVNINGAAGVSYNISSRQDIKLFFKTTSTRVLTVDTSLVKITKHLPEIIDMNTLAAGLNYSFNNTDYILNPVSGNELNVALSVGLRKINKNNALLQLANDGFDYGALYDTVQLKSYQLRMLLYGAHYFPLGRQSVLKAALNAGLLYSPTYYLNELFQLGGHKLLRGFYEERIFANQYAIGTLEYRFLFANNSYFFGFTDGGYSKREIGTHKSHNVYISGGLGMAFQTKAGIFNLTLANGQSREEPFKLQQTKVHVGYTALF